MVIEMFQFFSWWDFSCSLCCGLSSFREDRKESSFHFPSLQSRRNLASEFTIFSKRKYGRHLWFYGQRRAGEKKKFIPRRRSTVENEKRCGGWRSEWYWPLPFTSCEWPRQNFSLLYLCNIMQTSDENKEKYQLWDYRLNQYQILQANTMRIVWQTVGRINYEILGVKGLREYIKEKIWWQRNLKPRALILYFA